MPVTLFNIACLATAWCLFGFLVLNVAANYFARQD